jgi:hypothetical protein
MGNVIVSSDVRGSDLGRVLNHHSVMSEVGHLVSPKYKTAGKGLQGSPECEADLNAESSRERSKRSGLGWQISTNNYQYAAHTEALLEGIRRLFKS